MQNTDLTIYPDIFSLNINVKPFTSLSLRYSNLRLMPALVVTNPEPTIRVSSS